MIKKSVLVILILVLTCLLISGCMGEDTAKPTEESKELSGVYKLEYSIMLRYGDGAETGDGIQRDYGIEIYEAERGFYRKDNSKERIEYYIDYKDLDGNEITDKNTFHVHLLFEPGPDMDGYYDRTTKVLRLWDGPLDDKNTVTYKFVKISDDV